MVGIVDAIRTEIEAAKRIMVVSHIRPDGDAVGSLLGLGLALEAGGKSVQMVLADGVPQNFRHLVGWEKVCTQPDGEFDLIIVVDLSDMQRIGNVLAGFRMPDINIDHHPTNEGFARYNLVESDRVATCEIIAQSLSALGLPLTIPVANALLTGLITDTIGFRTKNVTPDVLRLVADLMEAGGALSEMYYPAIVSRTYCGARYWGAGLSRLQFNGRLVWSHLSLEDRNTSGYNGNDDADLINILSAIDDADIAIILVEQSPSRVKISWRSCGQAEHDVDVSLIAKLFGGGGHKAAAGAEVNGALTDIESRVIGVTQEYLTREIG